MLCTKHQVSFRKTNTLWLGVKSVNQSESRKGFISSFLIGRQTWQPITRCLLFENETWCFVPTMVLAKGCYFENKEYQKENICSLGRSDKKHWCWHIWLCCKLVFEGRCVSLYHGKEEFLRLQKVTHQKQRKTRKKN